MPCLQRFLSTKPEGAGRGAEVLSPRSALLQGKSLLPRDPESRRAGPHGSFQHFPSGLQKAFFSLFSFDTLSVLTFKLIHLLLFHHGGSGVTLLFPGPESICQLKLQVIPASSLFPKLNTNGHRQTSRYHCALLSSFPHWLTKLSAREVVTGELKREPLGAG